MHLPSSASLLVTKHDGIKNTSIFNSLFSELVCPVDDICSPNAGIIRPMFSIEHGSNSHNSSKDFKLNQRQNKPWATITQCDLSPRFFCNDATLLCKIESDKI